MLKNHFGYYILTLLVFLGLLYTSRLVMVRGSTITGVTDAKKYKITARHTVKVRKIFVSPGQAFHPGDTLITLVSPDLEKDIANVESRIEKLKAERKEKAKSVSAKIDYIGAQLKTQKREMSMKIDQEESELALNQQITSAQTFDSSLVQPRIIHLQGLKEQVDLIANEARIKIRDVRQQNESDQALMTNQIALLTRELGQLMIDRSELVKIAPQAGVVEQVTAKVGESFQKFTGLLTYNPEHPVSVIGYIVGKRAEKLSLNEKVEVWSYNHPDVRQQGEIIGFGAVVALPEILQKSTAVKAFGKEVFISITVKNDFFVGEKVLIR